MKSVRLPRSGRPLRPASQPVPLWKLYALLFAALSAAHIGLLGLPYYWDEAGYYIPAAWDFYRTGSLIPITTLTNAHPPLPSLYLAIVWHLAGFAPVVTRLAVVAVAALGLLAVWRLALKLAGSSAVAVWTVVLTALYPVWFAQSALAHADIFAAACALWGLVWTLPARERNPRAAAAWFAAAALAKETSIGIPAALAAYALFEALRSVGERRRRAVAEAAWLAATALPLAAWFAYHRFKTGFLFGNPEFLRYNAQANLSPLRFLAAFGHRLLHLSAHMNLFVPVLMAAAALLLAPRQDAEGHTCDGLEPVPLARIWTLIAVEAALFSILGGALLTRYLLPVYPLVLLLALVTLRRRAPGWQWLAAVSAVAFVAGLGINPPYGFAPEDNLAYARFVRLQQQAIHELEQRYPGATVLSAWPATDELHKPELGYVREPFDVTPIENFTSDEIDKAAENPESYSVALVFSTKYDPPNPLFTLGAGSRRLDQQYFGLHQDLPPEEIARRLHGTLVWKHEDQGLWAALIRFNRQWEAQSAPPGSPGAAGQTHSGL